jgi:hypothetical protein
VSTTQGEAPGVNPLTPGMDRTDSWWNPPWPHTWQRTYQQAQLNHSTGQDHSPTIQRWTQRQRTRWNTLHPAQQHLLTTIGIKPA